MEEISNRTLTILIITAIVISLGGTLVSLNKLGQVKVRQVSFTGFAGTNMTYGNVTLTISDITWINFSRKTCNWGSGMAIGGNPCKMNTSNYKNLTSCASSFALCADPLELKNIGNNNVTLNLTFKNSSAFLGGATAQVWFRMVNGTGALANAGCRNRNTNMSKFASWREISRAWWSNRTCDRLTFGTGQNTVSIHIQVRFGPDALAGQRVNQITAIGVTKIGG